MTFTIEIDSARDLPAGLVGRTLAAFGLSGPVQEIGSRLELGVLADDVEQVAARVLHALESLLAELPFPLIAQRVGTSSFHLHPPAG